MDKSFPPISYAQCVKTNSTESKDVDLDTAPMSWYDQVESYQNSIMSRANSMSTILSDDAAAALLSTAMHRNSISHSMDSGQLSDLSSDNEQCSKSSVKHCVNDDDDAKTTATTTTITNSSKQQKRKNVHRMPPLDRRESIDSCHTSSSVSCADPQCTQNHNQFSLMCQEDQGVPPNVAVKVESKFEYDEGILARRQKQIDYGKSTIGYELYTTQVPREKRTKDHPNTPDKTRTYSRRAFDGLIKIWRKQLHSFDPCEPNEPADTK